MAMFRVHKDGNYTVMSNHHIRNRELSNAAKGLMCVILSLPDDWEFSVDGIVSLCKDGVSAVRRQLDELEEHGYVVRESVRVHGRFSTVWDIHEMPVDSDEWRELPAEEYESQMEIPGLDGDLPDEPEPESAQADGPDTEGREPSGEQGRMPVDAEVTEQVVAYLNERTGKRFRPGIRKTRRLVRARLREGYAPEDFKTVIDNKVADWGGEPRMRRYLRPETLFGSKFEGYLNEGGGGSSGRFDMYND